MLHKIKPTYKDYIWGGHRLRDEFSKDTNTAIVAESWELSCHHDGESMLEDIGISLRQYLMSDPQAAGNACSKFHEFPMLIKFIDAASDLSIQVHPDNEYAMANEGQPGKTEMWYIVDNAPGAYIYYGFKEDITAAEFANSIQNNTLCEKLNKVHVQQGDVFFIEPGTIHTIGAGCLIVEVQQSSNVTYRVCDYGRLGPDGKARELHIKKACDVTNLKKINRTKSAGNHLVKCDYFTADIIKVINNKKRIVVDTFSFMHLLILDGNAQFKAGSQILNLQKGDGVFADAGTGEISINGNATILSSYVS